MAELLFEEQQREIVAELNDEAGPELSLDVDEATSAQVKTGWRLAGADFEISLQGLAKQCPATGKRCGCLRIYSP